MNRTGPSFVLALLMLWMPACGDHEHSHDSIDSGHDGDGVERPTVAVTRWTDRTELFMEYPVFMAGESGRSAVHLTDLATFAPLSSGEVIVSLQSESVVTAINGFVVSLAQAVVIVVIVLLIFMGLRSGLLIGFILAQTILASFIFLAPMGVALDLSGYIYVVDSLNYRIQKFSSPVTQTLETSWGRLKAQHR